MEVCNPVLGMIAHTLINPFAPASIATIQDPTKEDATTKTCRKRRPTRGILSHPMLSGGVIVIYTTPEGRVLFKATNQI